MKKLIIIFAAILMTANVFAQSPQKMSYQAVIRDAANALVTSKQVGMKISILQGSSSGSVVYTETQTPSTNANGLVSLEIGVSGVGFNTINWANGPYFIKTETDPSGGTAYTIAGTNELMSVPYALFSANGNGSDLWTAKDADTAFINRKVGIGTSTPTNDLDVKGGITTDSMHVLGELEVGSSVVTGDNPYNRIDGDDGDLYIQSYWKTGWSPRPYNVIITADQNPNGKVGIGTTTPTVKLDVDKGTLRVNRKTSDITPHILVSEDDNATDFGGIENSTAAPGFFIPTFIAKSDVTGWLGNGDTSNSVFLVKADPDVRTTSRRAAMRFDARNYSNTAALINKDLFAWGSYTNNYMLMDAQGQLGIGTTNPAYKLDVNGTASVSSMPNNSSAPYVVVSNSTGGQLFTQPISDLVGLPENDWHVNGNGAPIDDTNYIGTNINVPFNIKVDNKKAGTIDNTLSNAFYGFLSGNANTLGSENSAFGTGALSNNTTGSTNSASGTHSLFNNTSGSGNTADGFNALYYNTKGIINTATGGNALAYNTTGNRNTAGGGSALAANTTGSFNTAYGQGALITNTIGDNNTAIGHDADVSTSALTNATAIGYNAIVNLSNTMQLGNPSVTDVKTSGTLTAGAVTYLNTVGTSGQVLTTNGSGATSWTTPTTTGSGCNHFVGEIYGGGQVFYVYDGGCHGLILANSYSEVPWWTSAPRYTGTTGDGVNAGAMNTALIVAAQYTDNPATGNFAAKVCADLSVTMGGVTYGDWYLPSKVELNLLYMSSPPLAPFSQQWQYWSSTETSATDANNQLFSNGVQQSNAKSYTGIARAIRSF